MIPRWNPQGGPDASRHDAFSQRGVEVLQHCDIDMRGPGHLPQRQWTLDVEAGDAGIDRIAECEPVCSWIGGNDQRRKERRNVTAGFFRNGGELQQLPE